MRDPRVEPRAGDVLQRDGCSRIIVRWVSERGEGVAYVADGTHILYATSMVAWKKKYATATIIHVAEG